MKLPSEGEKIGGFTVQYVMVMCSYSYTLRTNWTDGKEYLVKVFDPDKTPAMLRDSSGEIREVVVCRTLKGNAELPFVADGTAEIDGKQCPYMVTRFKECQILSALQRRGRKVPPDIALEYYKCLLRELRALHKAGYIHNDIQPSNVMLCTTDGKPMAHIIGFGHVSEPCDGVVPFITANLWPNFQATETFWNTYSTASDVYSATAVLYSMLYGHAPWETNHPAYDDPDYRRKTRTLIHEKRREKLSTPNGEQPIPAVIKTIFDNGLAQKAVLRTKDAEHMLMLISSQERMAIKPEKPEETTKKVVEPKKEPKAVGKEDEAYNVPDGVKATGRGFADVAGLDSLKDILQKKVIFLLKNKELAQRYKLTPPNGILLYGPPGCGKTYFAEKFAEESGFNFHFVKASDLGSIYVHGSQGKIAELFKKAAKKAPSVICFDEFDAMVPQRDSGVMTSSGMSGEVNEFLSQLNNCSSRGLFVIGTTNKPDLIDQAVLRKGRLDLQVYIPAPDEATRKLMFELYLNGRPCGDIDTTELARNTENYVSSDIAYIVNDAAMIAAFADEPITQDKIENSIRSTQPSLNSESLHYYEKMRSRFESRSSQRRPMGFAVACGS